ncbi:DUF1203 domain-containing protein [Streptomyces sp. GC420]|uniref:DUF1203 domain-containing protein n=1 Tax=Streptomyces sp. GC420 TaxID=2697568 RepID=UPI00141514A3|nr:DUF1203 domain-containing protein [Streptomyces sp. GC420]NBM16166.1 DUF1203 domain-containing protein [Streptomyces sp. GC420]
MTTTSTIAFRVHALPAGVLEGVRARGVDAFGSRAEHITAEGGEPLRCCLRNAGPGEDLLLFGYQPPLPASPYREVGAVLAHAGPCAGPGEVSTYPPDWRGRPQVLRAYDARGWIHDATAVHDGQDPEAAIAEVLAERGVMQVHSRNVAWGCYMFTITRAGQGTVAPAGLRTGRGNGPRSRGG